MACEESGQHRQQRQRWKTRASKKFPALRSAEPQSPAAARTAEWTNQRQRTTTSSSSSSFFYLCVQVLTCLSLTNGCAGNSLPKERQTPQKQTDKHHKTPQTRLRRTVPLALTKLAFRLSARAGEPTCCGERLVGVTSCEGNDGNQGAFPSDRRTKQRTNSVTERTNQRAHEQTV